MDVKVEMSEDPIHRPIEPMRSSLSMPLMSNNNPQSVRSSMNEHNDVQLSEIPVNYGRPSAPPALPENHTSSVLPANYGRPSAPPALPVTRPKLTRSNGKHNLFQSTANRHAQIKREQTAEARNAANTRIYGNSEKNVQPNNSNNSFKNEKIKLANNTRKTKKSKRTWGQFLKNPFKSREQFNTNNLTRTYSKNKYESEINNIMNGKNRR